jgi:hypothetical protein
VGVSAGLDAVEKRKILNLSGLELRSLGLQPVACRFTYCWWLVTLSVVEGSYHLSRSGESSLVSVGTSSLECSVLKCGQVYSMLCCLTIFQDAAFQTGSTHADKTAPPAPREMV